MSIFGRQSDPPTPSPSTPARPAPSRSPHEPRGESTHIAEGTKVVGTVSGQAELFIEGEIDGQIQLDSRVVIGAKGRVKGEVEARSVQVGGKLFGNVRGLERVEVLASGSLEGDVVSPRVVIAEGAFFKGKVEMTGKSSSSMSAAPARSLESSAPSSQRHGGSKHGKQKTSHPISAGGTT